MAETHFSESNPSSSLKALFHALDPISLILSQNSKSEDPLPLKLTTMDSFIMERGPRYEAYANLRESRLRMKHAMQFHEEEEEEEVIIPTTTITPPRKQVKFHTSSSSSSSSMAYGTYYSPVLRKGSSSVLAQSVPDFSAALRKENRKPPAPFNALPAVPEMTPPAAAAKKSCGVLSNSRGSKSASAGEKKKKKNVGVLMARKSYANLEELRNLSSFAGAGAGDGRGGRINGYGGGRKTVLGYTQYF